MHADISGTVAIITINQGLVVTIYKLVAASKVCITSPVQASLCLNPE